MHLLDDPKYLKRYDTAGMHTSIAALAKQCTHAWSETQKLSLPLSFLRAIDQVVVAGMGGSALAPHIIAATCASALRVPLTVVRSYTLPKFLTRRSVVIASSYSGSTEETIAGAKEALARGARVIGITTGGPLAKLLSRHRSPVYRFEPRYNPCGQPRMGVGYTLFGHLGILHRLGVLSTPVDDIKGAMRHADTVHKRYMPSVPLSKNRAKQLASFLSGYIPVLFGPDFLEGSLHTFANQINENAKTFSAFFTLPELNHHLIEGFPFPLLSRRLLRPVLFSATHAHPRMLLRTKITASILRRNHFVFREEALWGGTALASAMTLLVLGSYASLYMALLGHRDPSPIPWVNYLKAKLA